TVRVKMSRPTSSVPNQWTDPGGWDTRSKWTLGPASPGKGARKAGTRAHTTSRRTIAAPTADSGFRRKRPSHRARRRGGGDASRPGSSVVADAGIDIAVQEIDQHVGEDEREPDHESHAHHGVEVLREDGRRAVRGDAGPREDHLDQERVLDQRAVGHA